MGLIKGVIINIIVTKGTNSIGIIIRNGCNNNVGTRKSQAIFTDSLYLVLGSRTTNSIINNRLGFFGII